jgi:hypothetical protein
MNAEVRERVTYVHYSFDISELYGPFSNEYKSIESFEKYARLCHDELQRMYPNAEIVVSPVDQEGIQPTSSKTLVYVSDNFEEVESGSEAQVVKGLCERIYQQFDNWLVKKNVVQVLDSSRYCSFSATTVRWACQYGLIADSSRHMGLWQVPLDGLLYFKNQYGAGIDLSQHTAGASTQILFLVWEELGDIQLAQLPSHCKLLISARGGFGVPLLTAHHSNLQVHAVDHDVEVIVNHFVDIVPWQNSRWAYANYASGMLHHAHKLNLQVEYATYQEDNTEIVCGVSFKFKDIAPSDTILKQHLESKFQILAEVIELAEISLKGGPEWKAIYETAEDPFRVEVIEKILKELGFTKVRHTHGPDEYGRDFICSMPLKSGENIHIGVQVKKGDISGGANSLIDTIISQIKDAFSIPFTRFPDQLRSENYIAIMIIATSGSFTNNAIQKILHQIPKELIGSVFFWDQATIRDLISQIWGGKPA